MQQFQQQQMQMQQLTPQVQNSLKPTNPYQQLKYVYQTENYQYFYQLVDDLTIKANENAKLKQGIHHELEFLRAKLISKSLEHQCDDDLEVDRDHYLREVRLLKNRYGLQDVLADAEEATDPAVALKKVNAHLKTLFRERIRYNELLVQTINEYQEQIMVIMKNLYKLFEGRTDEVRAKAETLIQLRLKLLQEQNHKISKLEHLNKLSEALLPL